MKKTYSTFLIVAFALTMLVYASVFVSPESFRFSGFISLLIPVFFLVNVVLTLFYLLRLSRKALLPVLSIVVGYQFFLITIPIHSERNSESEFAVLNYNMKRLSIAKKADKLIEGQAWVMDDKAPIKCFQEFLGTKNFISQIESQGYQAEFGASGRSLAIFSKYPIINAELLFDGNHQNNVLIADVVIKEDTIRIYNAHLKSMGIELSEISNSEEAREEYEQVKTKFVDGSVKRAEQIRALVDHARNSKYATLIVGDYNDIPFSYNHFKLRRNYKDSFEEAGKGFGFTYNGSIPFLRIDYQFHNSGLKCDYLEVLSDVTYSDHFPMKGRYSFLK